jgi:replicative DNA helicase
MKELARELNVPLLSAAQLSRAVEQRSDKRPQLSDLRESGCLAGESRVWLPDEGRYETMRKLNGKRDFRVLALNTETYCMEPATVSNAFCTGVKPVFKLSTALGRSIRATGNHKFLTIHGWKRLDELQPGDRIALPRQMDSLDRQTMSNAEISLLGHLIGDGCTLPKHAVQYTTVDADLAEIVVENSKQVFGDEVIPRIHKVPGKNWYQVFIASSRKLTHGVRNPVASWLHEFGVFGLRSYEKRIPDAIFTQPVEQKAIFIRHLWATDGCIAQKKNGGKPYPAVYYATSSEALARDLQSLLLHLNINARLKRVKQNGKDGNSKGRDQYHVIITGIPDLTRFTQIGAVGERKSESLRHVRDYTLNHASNTNRDVIPNDVWRMYAVPAMQQIGLTSRQMQTGLGISYCGTSIYKQNISRERASRLAEVVQSKEIEQLATSDVYWDKITDITPDGETEVYDLTVPGNANFVAQDIVVHNSIEQDADIVMFLYRDVVYNEATEAPNQADVIVAKHRNGPTDTIPLYFDPSITRFRDGTRRQIDLSSM